MSAALLAKLIEAGTPADLVGEVAMELARAQAASEILEKRRAKDRERKAVPRNSTESEESAETAETPPPNENISNPPSVSPVSSNELTSPSLKPEHVVEVWNENAPTWGLKPIRKLTAQRRRKLVTRIRENSIDEFTEAIAAIGRSPFLRGENQRGWRANFDWMLEPSNFTKLTEGNYDR